MENSLIIALMAKKADKSASPEELEELARLLAENPAQAYFHELVYALKGNQDHLELVLPREEMVDHGWQDLESRLNSRRAGGKLRRISFAARWIAAAVLLGGLVMGGLAYFQHRPVKTATVQVETLVATAGFGAKKELVLPDGTRVWLNAGSKLAYPAVFIGGKREVELEGEAFFNVAPDSKAPFSVHARKITIGVLGTSFNVKAYRDEHDIETTLISGKVQVILDNEPEKPILLSPNEKLTIVNETEDRWRAAKKDQQPADAPRSYNALRYKVQALPVRSGNVLMETAWVDNKLVIDDESFETVARMLERKYDVTIHFRDAGLMQERLSGVFEKESIDEVLRILAMTTEFRYVVEGKTIYLSKYMSGK